MLRRLERPFKGRSGTLTNLYYVAPLLHPCCTPQTTVCQKTLDHSSICACHPCAGAMLIFSVSFQFYQVSRRTPTDGVRLLIKCSSCPDSSKRVQEGARQTCKAMAREETGLQTVPTRNLPCPTLKSGMQGACTTKPDGFNGREGKKGKHSVTRGSQEITLPSTNPAQTRLTTVF